MNTDSQVYDEAMNIIADYVCSPPAFSQEAYHTARLCLADSLGCAIHALSYPACTKLLGPIVSGTIVPNGSRVPGTDYVLDPINAAFNIGTMIRWLDYNDTWLAAEWGHPSDNLGGILAVADYVSQTRLIHQPFCVNDILVAMIQAHEIQGGLSLLNSFNRIGFDHVIFVKIATAAVTTRLFGGNRQKILAAISNAFIDAGPLRTYRHSPNTGSRKSWAAGDATSRGVMLAMMAMKGEMGYPKALSAAKWGLYDVLFQGRPFVFERPLGCYVMENILFKVSFPAEFHAQTAVECALKLYPVDVEDVSSIEIITHESAMRIINKTGPLHNPADRDHCLQYMVAIALLYGTLTAQHYENEIANDPRIDLLRQKMHVTENEQFTKDYLDPNKRSIANEMIIHLKNGKKIGPVKVEYPLGHRMRRQESLPFIFQKFSENLSTKFSKEKVKNLISLFHDHNRLTAISIPELMEIWL